MTMCWAGANVLFFFNHPFSEPWSRGSEALSWEAWAWEGSATESYGGEQQLQQDGRGEAQSEDGGQQREPHSTYGSHEWEIQGEGECFSLMNGQTCTISPPWCWNLTLLFFSCSLIGQEVRRGAKEQGDQRGRLGRLKVANGGLYRVFYVSKDWFIFCLASIFVVFTTHLFEIRKKFHFVNFSILLL